MSPKPTCSERVIQQSNLPKTRQSFGVLSPRPNSSRLPLNIFKSASGASKWAEKLQKEMIKEQELKQKEEQLKKR